MEITYPSASDHTNNDIREFLNHFSSLRKIVLSAKVDKRKRSDQEKEEMKAAFESEATAESESFSKIAEEREQQKEQRQAQKEEAFKAVDEEREL